MTCYFPHLAYTASNLLTNTGKPKVHFLGKYAENNNVQLGKSVVNGVEYNRFLLPCGKCIGCRLERSKVWAIRCMHELKSHSESCFVTLTYNDTNLPLTGYNNSTLRKKDVQDFFKRLRKDYSFRYYYCGEYGEKTSRPHYHVILFGFRPRDLQIYKRTPNGDILYTSEYLTKKWNNGHVVIGDVTFDSCAYVARYILKKQVGPDADYGDRLPPFVNMSLKPGLGYDWYQQYKKDVYSYDTLVIYRNGEPFKCKPPKYYDKLYDLENHSDMERIKEVRSIQAVLHPYDRLFSKEVITTKKMNKFHVREV